MSLAHLLVALTGASTVPYGVMMALFARAIAKRSGPRITSGPYAPGVSVLKPLAGYDDDLDANLDSFAAIDYPAFEILLGVASTDDPAFPAARRFVARHPEVRARIVVTDPFAALNPKVAQLVGLERAAIGDVLVISDSNVRVEPDYVWSLVAELRDPRVGMATSLFSGTGERSLGAALENLQICVSTAPGMAALNAVGEPLAVGKSMALRRRDLVSVGGFAAVGGVVAEDCLLGRLLVGKGFRLRVAGRIIENRNVGCSIGRTVERHTRWAKLRRALHPLGFAFEPLLNPVVVASFAVLAAPCGWTAASFAIVCLVQTLLALWAVKHLRGHPLPWRYAPLEIVRSYASFLCWILAATSRKIRWRGHPIFVGVGTAIVSAAPIPERGDAREGVAA